MIRATAAECSSAACARFSLSSNRYWVVAASIFAEASSKKAFTEEEADDEEDELIWVSSTLRFLF